MLGAVNHPSTIGASVLRNDGVAKVTGGATYVDDLRPEGCWYGATVRSTHAHARLLGVSRDPAFDWSRVVLVTAADIPGDNVVHLMTDDQPVLAADRIRHCTEPVALVAAPTRDLALEAARRVRLEVEPLPALLDPEQAAGHAIRIYGEDNVFHRLSIHKGGMEHSAAATAWFHQGVYRVGLQEQLYIEPQGMIAIPRDGHMSLFGSMQCPYYVDKAVKRMLGHDRVNVVQTTTGGGFGGKEEYPSMVACHAALLARAAGRPVKLVYRRDEDLRATTKRHPAVITIRSVAALDGQLLEWQAELVLDGGAYNTLSPVVLSRAMLHLTGPYRCPTVHLTGRAVATNTPPNGAFRGFGAPQALFAVERHMDRIARHMDLDPVELRRANLYRDGDRTATGQTLVDTGGLRVLDEALAAAQAPLADFAPHAGGGHARLRRGRGVSVVFHGCGFTGNGESWLKGRVALSLHGARVCIHTASTDIGQGAETTFMQICAAELGIPVERIDMAPHDTGAVPDSGPTVASRTCMVVGGVVQKAAQALRRALQAETDSDERDFDALLARRPSVAPLRVEHQYQDDGSLQWDPATYQGDAYPTFGWAACVVDLDVDLDTGEVLYRRLVTATDVGRAINPVIVEGQLEGGALQALGWATMEEVTLDDQARMRNDRLTNYIIPTSADAPEMVTRVVEIPYARGPFGAKGIGEIPMDGPAPAVAQAVERATGAVIERLPLSPERILGALAARGAGGHR
jgi:CO/xanthine dehydrogenase Mo-binding subunit